MTDLPPSSDLPVEHLAACFNKVTNSYKFYWFLAILEHLRENHSAVIPINDLLARMVASVWYPANYFRLSFGKQDRLGQIAVQVGEHTLLPIDSKRQEVIHSIQELSANSPTAYEITSLGEYAPFRFLRPFFTQQLRGLSDWKVNEKIKGLAEQTFTDPQSPCIYRFVSQPAAAIEIQASWFKYLNQHLTILTGFCLWNLVNYIQKNNPNVPNISNKLFEPMQRDLNQARTFWRLVIEKSGSLACIYSGQVMQKSNFSLDHFLPWRFVAHDLLWNIIPTPKSVNSAKNDNLPDLKRYFDGYAHLQFNALEAVADSGKHTLLEDHILLLGISSVAELQALSFAKFREKLHDTIAPQFQIAANMGFAGPWSYT